MSNEYDANKVPMVKRKPLIEQIKVKTSEPSCLNEIPVGCGCCPECEDMRAVEYRKYVQRLVCRRIIEIEDMLSFNVGGIAWTSREIFAWKGRIQELKTLFNITDAMIEEERKRCE